MSRLSVQQRVEAFLDGRPHAVIGASRDRAKYGNKVLRCYQQNGRTVYPVHPAEKEVEGLAAYPSLRSLPETPHGVSIITPPPVTEKIVEEAGQLGIRHLWMQPGAESERAVARAKELGINVIGGDACILVVLGYSEH